MSEQESTLIKKYIHDDENGKANEENNENENEENEGNNKIEIFDDGKDLLNGESLDNLIYYGFYKINIFYDKTKGEITNFQLTYRCHKNKHERVIIPLKLFPNNPYNINKPEGFRLIKNEYLKKISFRRVGKKLTQINFETTKNRTYTLGKDEGELIELNTDDKNDIILAMFGSLSNLGIYYLKTDPYIKKFCCGMSELKKKLEKDATYKKQLEEKYNTFSEIDKYIYRTALLPKTPFISILKYILSERRFN
jgi:hypothetical protein